jgi:hypothetical protein
MSTQPLPISDIVNIAVYLSPAAVAAPFPNQGAIVGTTVASSGGPTHANRMIQVTSAASLLTLGYLTSSPEYIAAQLYFSQSPAPNFLWVGLQDLSSLSGASGATIIDAEGTNYTVGDVVNVIQGSPANGSGGWVQVTSIGAGGAVTGIETLPLNDGTGYSLSSATGLATSHVTVANPSASGLTISLTAIGETPLTALENCRAFNQIAGGAIVPMWYGYYSTTAADADAEAMALFAQSAQPVMKFYYSTSTATIPTNATTDVASYCKSNDFGRIEILYSTTQGGNAPNNAYAGAASMGMEMGRNTGLPNSWFDKFSQTLIGVTPEPISQNQLTYIVGKYCNVYTWFGPFPIFTQGVMSSGVDAAIVLFTDVIVYQIQYNIMDDIKANGAYTITDPGEQRAIHQVNLACQYGYTLGALSSGVWSGASFAPPLNLVNGQSIPNGYLAQALPIALLSASARAARQLQPIIVALLMTEGAISVSIGLYVQQGQGA